MRGSLDTRSCARRCSRDSAWHARNRLGQSGLWAYGISGDLPIVLLRVAELGKTKLVSQLVQAHIYWRGHGLPVELVIWNEDQSGYRQNLHDQITTTPQSPTPAPWSNILANPWFGTVVSETGSAYTWCENTHSFRLSPWNDDPISDISGEAFYLRAEETGQF